MTISFEGQIEVCKKVDSLLSVLYVMCLPENSNSNSSSYKHFAEMVIYIQEGKETYPTSCSGWLWITNPGTSKAIAKAASEVKFFWIDDVWVTGYIAKHLKILHQVDFE